MILMLVQVNHRFRKSGLQNLLAPSGNVDGQQAGPTSKAGFSGQESSSHLSVASGYQKRMPECPFMGKTVTGLEDSGNILFRHQCELCRSAGYDFRV